MAFNNGQCYLHTGRFAIQGADEVKVNFTASISISFAFYELLEQAGFFACTETPKANFATIGPTFFNCFHLEEQMERCERILKKLASKLPEHATQVNKVREHLYKHRNNWVLVPQQKLNKE